MHSTIASIQYLYSLLTVIHDAAAGGWGRIETVAEAEAKNQPWEELLPTLKEALRSHERLVVVWAREDPIEVMFDGLAAPLAVMRETFDSRRRRALRAPDERDRGERDDAAAQVQALRELAREHLWVEQLGDMPTMRASGPALVDRYPVAAYDRVDRIQPTRFYQR